MVLADCQNVLFIMFINFDQVKVESIEILIIFVETRKSSVVVTENHAMKLFSKEILRRPGPRFPTFSWDFPLQYILL